MSQETPNPHDLPQGVGMTALIVAQARALESRRPDRLFADPLAEAFVTEAGPAFPVDSEAIANLLRLRGPYVALRTRFYDDFLRDALGAGCRQVVLLAAGLDARAFRLAWPPGVTLFELDLPGVLAFKERALARHAVHPGCRRVLVPVDLAADWPVALTAAGFVAGAPAAWVAEGILMYLAEAERDLLLDRIATLAAPGSRLALDHRGAALAPAPDAEQRSVSDAQAAEFGVRIPGARREPSLAAPAAWLAGHGWQADVSDAAELFSHCGRPEPAAEPGEAVQMWLATARRGCAVI